MTPFFVSGSGSEVTKRREGWRGSSSPSPGRSPCGEAAATCDEPWLCGVSHVLSDLSNLIVIMYTRYQYISPVSGHVLTYAGTYPLPRFCDENVPPQFSIYNDGGYPVTIVARFEWAMRYQAWRSLSHTPRTYPFTLSGALARFIPFKRQSHMKGARQLSSAYHL